MSAALPFAPLLPSHPAPGADAERKLLLLLLLERTKVRVIRARTQGRAGYGAI